MVKRISKKSQVLEQILWELIEKKSKDLSFDNDLVKAISGTTFKNQFDVTKLDNKTNLPKILTKNDYAVIHLGSGNHKFIKGINKVFHGFEPIQKTIDWQCKRSLLNQCNSSKSNILSVANNQRILHHFLFGQDTEFDDIDITKRPKTYFPHRTKTSFEYFFGKDAK